MSWGKVATLDPLAVALDGDLTAVTPVTKSLTDVSLLSVGDMVWCELSAGRLILHGRAGGSPPMRLPFDTKTALDLFTGWPGLIGFVEADNSEYLWLSGWKLWSRPRASFTPSWSGLTVGDGTIQAFRQIVGGEVTVDFSLVFGSTTVVTGPVSILIGLSITAPPNVLTPCGGVMMQDVSAGLYSPGFAAVSGNGFRFFSPKTDTVPASFGGRGVDVSMPWTWAVGDQLAGTCSRPLA